MEEHERTNYSGVRTKDAKYKLLDQEMEHNLIAYRVAIVQNFQSRSKTIDCH